MQKVPMPPNRDVVRDSYLRDIYSAVLIAMVDEINYDSNNGKTWVRIAVGNPGMPEDVIKKVLEKRYGNKVMLWSSDMKANEKAEQDGYEVVNPRSLDTEERKAFESVGLVHTTNQFATPTGTGNEAEKYINETHWTPGMRKLAEFTKTLGRELVGKEVTVKVYNFIGGSAADYDYNTSTLRYNLVRLSHAFFDDVIGAEQISLIEHEIAHDKGGTEWWHNWKYLKNFESLSGAAVMLALRKPEVFELVGK